MSKMEEKCVDKQLIITTHSAFVLNKLGIEHLILIGDNFEAIKLINLSKPTQDYFRKLAGYDTLRLVLAKKSILVEGPSDELFVQKAYLRLKGKLPIRDGIDIISVRGLSFKRFLEIAKALNKEVVVFTDNDGNYVEKVQERYKEFIECANIHVISSKNDLLSTLEPNIVDCNDLEVLNDILGFPSDKRKTNKQEILDVMIKNKTEAALKFFSTNQDFTIPIYISDAFK